MAIMIFFIIFAILTIVALGGFVVGILKIVDVIMDDDYCLSYLGFGFIFSLIFGITTFVLGASCGGYDQVKAYQNYHHAKSELKDKIKDLSSLRQNLSDKKLEIQRLEIEYQNDISLLSAEIRTDQKASAIQTYDQARQNTRISYDLTLICRKKAYIAKLQETEVKLQQGTFELEFLEREAIDDQKLLTTLNNQEVEKLVGDINKVIAKYLPEAGKLAIEVDPNTMQTPEQIWQQINSGK